MRKQYHFRRTPRGLLAWDVDRLISESLKLDSFELPLSEIRELDEAFWFRPEEQVPTCRQIAQHAKLINETDLRYPILLSWDGRVMDGMHRVCRALIEGRETILARQFTHELQPDYIDVAPEDLSYEPDS